MNLTDIQLDALRELLNIGVGRAAGVLNEMLDSYIRLQIPSVRITTLRDLELVFDGALSERLSAVRMGFDGAFSGSAAMLFPYESAAHLVSVLTGEERGTPDLDSVRSATLSEVGNIVLNSVMGSIGNVLEKRMNYSLPNYVEGKIAQIVQSGRDDATRNDHATVLLAQTRFGIEELRIEGDILLVFDVGAFDALLTAIDRCGEEDEDL